MKFIDNNIQDYTGTDFNVFKNPDGVTIMKFNDTQQWLSNMEQYGNLFLGGCDSCSSFYKDSFDGFSYDSVLVAGLGFGLIPQELITSKNCSKVDVVEINQEVINYNNTSGHLDSNINIFQSDVYEYTTLDLYDLIIIDEIESILRQFNSPTFKGNSRECFEYIEAIMKNSTKIISLKIITFYLFAYTCLVVFCNNQSVVEEKKGTRNFIEDCIVTTKTNLVVIK